MRSSASLVLTGLLLSAPAAPADVAKLEFFETKVRPVLAEHCYSCHSAAGKKARGGLTLDSRAGMLKGGDTGPVLLPGQPDKSALLRALDHAGDLKMPPKGKLPAAAIADLTRWVRDGAVAPDDRAPAAATGIDWGKARAFWSFQPVRRPLPPATKYPSRVRNGVDSFILARLEAERIAPVAPASRATLIRRLTFDLTGLPPSIDEIEAFLTDRRPDAYERLVDRLLASPAHGERWARHWLDVARYAEDQAHTFGVKPNTAAWRYRDWVISALNADLPYDRFVRLQIAADLVPDAAPADRAALGFFGLGAQYYKNTDAARATADELDDRVDTLARGFLGLTVSCARCHDHKYDPVTMHDYYGLAGVFHSSQLAEVFLAPAAQVEAYQQANRRHQEAEKAFKDLLKQEKTALAAASIERAADYLLAAWRVRAALTGGKREVIVRVAADARLDADLLDRFVKLIDPANGKTRNLAALAPWRKPLPRGAEQAPAEVVESARAVQKQLAAMVAKKGDRGSGADRELIQAFLGDNGALVPADDRVIDRLPSERRVRMEQARTRQEEARRAMPPTPPLAHGLQDGTPADHAIYLRGNPATKGPPAPRRFLRVLSSDEPPRFRRGSGRLELADAIASADNPLTARVIVNRLWQHHFGRGLVGTPSNFGAPGERPTHPELLDWLADELIGSGWSLKHVHRLIVTSATYRLASESSPEHANKDPDNRLYGRGKRRRLDVEAWRDALLAASGRLDRALGGPTLNLDADGNERRTVYAKISRHELNGLLRLFDFPDANLTSERRTETTVPQQQLFALNSPFIIARARALGERMRAAGSDPAAQVHAAYCLALGRAPAEAERQLAIDFLTAADDPAEAGRNQLSRPERLAQVLLAGNEFLHVD